MRRDVPPELARIVAKALRKDPSERYQSMRGVVADLKHLAASRGAAAPAQRKALPLVPFVVLVLVAALAFGLRGLLGGGSTSATHAGKRFGVIGFENVGDPLDSGHLVRMLVPLVTTDLAETGGLEVLSTARIRESQRQVLGPEGAFDASFAREIARVAGAELMLVGDLTEERGGLRVVAELVEVASGRTLGSARAQGRSQDELFAMATTLCAEVRARLRLPAPAGGAEPFDAAASLTVSTAAWNRFVAGRLELHDGRYEQAIEQFEAALREDETFALASFYLALAIDWNGASDVREVAALERGVPYLDRLPARWRATYEAALASSHHEWADAHAKLVALIDAPDVLPDALNLMGELLEHEARYWNPALARKMFERARAIDPTYDVVLFHLVDTLLLQGDDDALEELIAGLRARDPSSARALVAEVTSLVWRRRWHEAWPLVDEMGRRQVWMDWWFQSRVAVGSGRRADAERLLEDGIARASGFLASWARHSRGLARLEWGRFEEALADFDAAFAPAREHEEVVRNAGVSIALDRARLLELMGDAEGAIASARTATELVPHEARAHFWLVQLLLRHGRPERVAQALATFAALEQESENVSYPFWADMLAAEQALHRSELAGAREALVRAATHPREARDLPVQHWLAARLAEAEGDVRRAIEEYAGVVPTYSWDMESHRQLWLEARLRRGCLQADSGDPTFDRGDLERLVEAWGNTGLQAIEDARRRLER